MPRNNFLKSVRKVRSVGSNKTTANGWKLEVKASGKPQGVGKDSFAKTYSSIQYTQMRRIFISPSSFKQNISNYYSALKKMLQDAAITGSWREWYTKKCIALTLRNLDYHFSIRKYIKEYILLSDVLSVCYSQNSIKIQEVYFLKWRHEPHCHMSSYSFLFSRKQKVAQQVFQSFTVTIFIKFLTAVLKLISC